MVRLSSNQNINEMMAVMNCKFLCGALTALIIMTAGQQFIRAETLGEEGFYGIPWGANLAEASELRVVELNDRIETYELKKGPPQLGEAKLSKLQFVALEGKFARVSIRYSGESNHKRILDYFKTKFGPVERSPGSMMRGTNQQFTWRNEETEVN